jgi:putative peptidoglycan lipid II flippase
MIRATAGTWLNYATTLAFQVLFARTFGAGRSSASYQLAFYVGISISGVFVSTAQAVFVPRLSSAAGDINPRMLRNIGELVAVGGAGCLVLAILSTPLAALIGGANLSSPTLVTLFRLTAPFAFAQILAGALGAMALTRGSRFLPALAPAGPSTAGAIALIVDRGISVTDLYLVVLAGSLIQVVIFVPQVFRIRLGTSAPIRDAKGITLVTLAQYALLAVTTPLEIRLSALHSAAGGSDYTYAMRALSVAQSLIVGGLIMSALGDWSRIRSEQGAAKMEPLLLRALTTVASTLIYSLSVVLLVGSSLVALLYQRGAFTASDTAAVYGFLAVASFGWAFESLSLLLTQALFSAHRNDLALRTGVSRTVVRVVLVTSGALTLGLRGVAWGYTCAALYGIIVNTVWVVKIDLISWRAIQRLCMRCALQSPMLAIGFAALIAGHTLPFVPRLTFAVVFISVPATIVLRSSERLRLRLRSLRVV